MGFDAQTCVVTPSTGEPLAFDLGDVDRINFRREPVSLEQQACYHRYAIGAGKLPDLRRLRLLCHPFVSRDLDGPGKHPARVIASCYSGGLNDCPYCSASAEDAWIINEYAVAIPPANPIASCHVIVAPRRHVASFYDLDVQEQRVIWDMLHDLRKRITEALAVQGFDAGFVDVPAGKEPAHTHVHLVPRVAGETVQLRSEAEWVDLT